MKEQVITPRMSGRSGGVGAARSRAGGEIVQRPAKRERGRSASASARSQDGGLRAALAYFPLVARFLLAVALGVMLFLGYRAAASASFFQVRKLDVSGTSRASADEIRSVVRRSAGQTGVWRADLSSISTELERLPWVRSAVVSRVMPDGLRVRVTERVPRAVVRTSAGKFIWVDEDAVSLGQMSTTDRMPPFFIRGWDESGTDEARAENRLRVQKYLEMSRDWETAGLSQRVSEINLGDLRDVRAQLAGDDSEIEVRLGERDFGTRLKRALKALDEQRNTPRGPFITYIVALDPHIVIGTRSGALIGDDNAGASGGEDAEAGPGHAAAREAQPSKTSGHRASAGEATARKDREPAQKRSGSEKNKDNEKSDAARKEDGRKERTASDAKSQTRPRRVG